MTVLVCLDDDGGMLFNHRRQSRDRAVLACLSALATKRPLWVSSYSAAMFEDPSIFRVDDRYHERMAREDACFAEDGELPLERADELVIFRWNRRYPADRRFPLDTLEREWTLVASRDIVGSSHERITEEHYRKKDVTA